MSRLIVLSLAVLLAGPCGGCVSTPPEVIKLHAKQAMLLNELERSHLALLEAYIEEKLESFERFYFETYGPRYRANWLAAFEQQHGRPYDEERDFPLLYNDLVAEYQERIEPIQSLRRELTAAVRAAYADMAVAHSVTGDWIESVQSLSGSQRRTADTVLGAVNPSLSVEAIDEQIDRLRRLLDGKEE
jgi:hypothetical protein